MAALSKLTAGSTFPFRKLPAEIRIKIYELLLLQKEPIRLEKEILGTKTRVQGCAGCWNTRCVVSSSICRVSKQLAKETLPVLYSNTFVIDMGNQSTWEVGGSLFAYKALMSRILVRPFYQKPDPQQRSIAGSDIDFLARIDFLLRVAGELENSAKFVPWVGQFTGIKYLKIEFELSGMREFHRMQMDVVQEVIKLGRKFPTATLEIDGVEVRHPGGETSERWLRYVKEKQELHEYIISSLKSAQKERLEEVKAAGESS